MASAQYLQTIKDVRDMEQQRVYNAMKQQSAMKSAMLMPSKGGQQRLMAARPVQQLMGEETVNIAGSKISKKTIGAAGILTAGLQVVNNYANNIGALTGNKAAENSTKNTLAKGGFAIGLAGSIALTMVNPAAGALTLAVQALSLATENEKMIRKFQEINLQSNKDTQRLGYITYSRGR
jgi:hypothetical protein